MEHITQEVREGVLSLIPHENHRKLADMLMDGVDVETIKSHGFDDIQITEYTSLIESVANGSTIVPEAPKSEEVAQPEDTTTTTPESTPETVTTTEPVADGNGEDKVSDQPQAETPVETTQPEATQPEDEQPSAETTTDTEPSTEGNDPVVGGEIPA